MFVMSNTGANMELLRSKYESIMNYLINNYGLIYRFDCPSDQSLLPSFISFSKSKNNYVIEK